MSNCVKNEREVNFDILRSLAIMAVIAIHSTYSGWQWYGDLGGSWNYYFTLIIKQFYCFAVPSFFFMSGYFFSSKMGNDWKKETEHIVKRMERILVPYLVWSVIVFFIVKGKKNIVIFLNDLLSGKVVGAYYYIIVLAIFTLLSPLLVRLKDKSYGLMLVLLINTINIVVVYFYRIKLGHNFNWWYAAFPFTTWISFYYFGILYRYGKVPRFILNIQPKKAMAIVLAMLFLSLFEAFALVSLWGQYSGAASSSKFSSFLYSFSIIIFFISIRKLDLWFPYILKVISSYSFGIYLIHEIIRGGLVRYVFGAALEDVQPVLQLLVFSSTLFLSILVICIAKEMIPNHICTKYLGF
ncbi:acyltransferase [Desulfovibrio sp. Fe33]|uniref:acyltransferase n=1 Tax=Desulfovibrio sp. Fe33 TaxID=3020842 RepID=UPI00234E046A|nr:acyltransferase [Desulfovibrio sp. Fe33]